MQLHSIISDTRNKGYFGLFLKMWGETKWHFFIILECLWTRLKNRKRMLSILYKTRHKYEEIRNSIAKKLR